MSAADFSVPTDLPSQHLVLSWPTDDLTRALGAIVPDCAVEVLPSIDSTNSELMRRARSGRPSPTLLIAEYQTAGRGRQGRNWHSPGPAAGALPYSRLPALTFSIGLAMAPRDWLGLSLAVGVGVARTLHPALGLKWPNDIWLQERKLAGILIETTSMGEQRYVVVGIGINIAPRDPTGLSTPPASLQELLPASDGPALMLQLAPALMQTLRLFEAQGFDAFHAAFAERDVLRNRPVLLSDGVQGIAGGVNAQGALLVHTSSGMKLVTSAEVSVRPDGARADPR